MSIIGTLFFTSISIIFDAYWLQLKFNVIFLPSHVIAGGKHTSRFEIPMKCLWEEYTLFYTALKLSKLYKSKFDVFMLAYTNREDI
jgi:hypothetical protein